MHLLIFLTFPFLSSALRSIFAFTGLISISMVRRSLPAHKINSICMIFLCKSISNASHHDLTSWTARIPTTYPHVTFLANDMTIRALKPFAPLCSSSPIETYRAPVLVLGHRSRAGPWGPVTHLGNARCSRPRTRDAIDACTSASHPHAPHHAPWKLESPPHAARHREPNPRNREDGSRQTIRVQRALRSQR